MAINERKIDADERSRLIALAHKLGCVVYQRDPNEDTWFYYTDGTSIGYVQFPRREASKMHSVHKPSKQAGTGFDAGAPATAEDMRRAMAMHTPGWATTSERSQVVKWEDWDDFHKNGGPYNAEYKVVTA